ncbi:MAG: response regulator [Clostridia bacterium]|nr:response regulator [Clostridia bacterium]
MYKYRIVIADDEPVIRYNLKDLLTKKFDDIECVALCGDGRQVINTLQKGNVDIVITDIQMPGVSGIDVAQYIYSHKLYTKVILVTGYSEFEYAHKAITYGVQQFLLKPINFGELILAVDTIKNDMREHVEELQNQSKSKIQLRGMIRKYIALYLLGVIPYKRLLEFDPEYVDLFQYNRCAVVSVDVSNADGNISENSRDNDKWIDICEIQNSYINCFCISEFENQIQLLFFIYTENEEDGDERVLAHVEECRRLMHSAYGIDFTYDVKYYERLENQSISNYDKLSNLYIKHLIHMNNETNDELLNIVISTMPIHNVHSFLQGVVERLSQTYPLDTEALNLKIKTIENTEDAAGFSKYLSDALREALKGKDMIRKVILYVNEHYCDKNLDLNRIANKFHFNRSYLSRIFKQQTGQNPSDYIFNLRINESKKLLQSRKYTVKKVAEMVGYSDEKYFGQAFKKATGVTPSSFMHSLNH